MAPSHCRSCSSRLISRPSRTNRVCHVILSPSYPQATPTKMMMMEPCPNGIRGLTASPGLYGSMFIVRCGTGLKQRRTVRGMPAGQSWRDTLCSSCAPCTRTEAMADTPCGMQDSHQLVRWMGRLAFAALSRWVCFIPLGFVAMLVVPGTGWLRGSRSVFPACCWPGHGPRVHGQDRRLVSLAAAV
jgi:hypothetical protein